MARSMLNNVLLRGLSVVAGSRKVDNLDVSEPNKSARERLVRNIGIRYRRLNRPGQTFCDLAKIACDDLISKIGWTADSIDALIMVTQSSDYIIPSTAIILQDELGLPISCIAFDINLGCSGYPYGLFVAGRMLSETGVRRALVVIGDQSASDGAQDAGREILFSDAATATAIEYSTDAPPMFFEGFSDGSGHKAIYVPHGGKRHPVSEDSFKPMVWDDGVIRSNIDVYLNGPAILNFSIVRAPDALRSIMEFGGVKIDDVDGFYMHQANRMINETIRKKMKLEPERMPESLHDFGNTSSASIPLTLAYRHVDLLRTPGKKMVMCGFGIGLSWASLYLTTPPGVYCSGIIEDV